MPRKQLQEGEGMTRPSTSSSPKPDTTRVGRFKRATGESDMNEFNQANVQTLQELCDDCCKKCEEKGLTEEAEQCEGLKTQCESANQALSSGARMATDWFSFALAAMKMIADILSKLSVKDQPA